MKRVSFACLFIMMLLISISTYALGSKCVANKPGCVVPRTTEVKVRLGTSPCGRNVDRCIDVLIWPSAIIEIFKIDGGKVDTFETPDFPNQSIPTEFTSSLFAGRYFFYIFNKSNKQATTFGPVEIFPDVKRMTLFIMMYNSMASQTILSQDREMCLTQNIEEYFDTAIGSVKLGQQTQCNSTFNDLPRVIKPIE
ncbi:MAG: hypothetical protein ABIE74_01810 [Pseudomonadota bacterium]